MIGSVTIVVPFVWSEVMEATDGRVPTFLLNTSKGRVTMPPGTGPLRTGRYSVLSAGADERWMPLEPSRFSAPQLIARPDWSGSPELAFNSRDAADADGGTCPRDGGERLAQLDQSLATQGAI